MVNRAANKTTEINMFRKTLPNKANSGTGGSATILNIATRVRNGGNENQVVVKRTLITTNQKSDCQNTRRTYTLVPSLLKNFILRKKMTYFDLKRIRDRIVEIRALGIHGFWVF